MAEVPLLPFCLRRWQQKADDRFELNWLSDSNLKINVCGVYIQVKSQSITVAHSPALYRLVSTIF